MIKVIKGWEQFLPLQRPNCINTRIYYIYQVGTFTKPHEGNESVRTEGKQGGIQERTTLIMIMLQQAILLLMGPWRQYPYFVRAASQTSQFSGKIENNFSCTLGNQCEAKPRIVNRATDHISQIPAWTPWFTNLSQNRSFS